jgi:hypothetical protein
MGTISATKLIRDDENYYVQGKFFIIKCNIVNQLPGTVDIVARLRLKYRDINGNPYQDEYYVKRSYLGTSSLDINISTGLCTFFHGKFMRQMMREYHRRDGNSQVRENANNFLNEVNLKKNFKIIENFLNSFWIGKESEKERLLTKSSELIENIINNINNIPEFNVFEREEQLI